MFFIGKSFETSSPAGLVVLMLQTVATHLVYYDKMFVVST